MIKLISFLPAISGLFTSLFAGFNNGFDTVDPMVYVYLALLFLAAILISFTKWIGSLFAIVTIAALLVSSFAENGFNAKTLTIGAVMLIAYTVIGIITKKRSL